MPQKQTQVYTHSQPAAALLPLPQITEIQHDVPSCRFYGDMSLEASNSFHRSYGVQPQFATETNAKRWLSTSLLSTCNYTCHSVKPQHKARLRSLSQLCPVTWKTYYVQKKMSLPYLCFHHLAEILKLRKKGRLESRLKRHTWCFLHKDNFGILQKVMASQYHFLPSNNRKAVCTLLLHQRQFLGRSLSWRVIKEI